MLRVAQQRGHPGCVGRPRRISHEQPLALRVVHHLGAVRLFASSHDEFHGVSSALELGRRRNGHEPALVRVEAADLEPEMIGAGCPPQIVHHLRVRFDDRLARDSIRDHDRVLPPLPHAELHVPADCGDRGGEVQAGPVDPVEAVRVVGVPEHHHAIAQATVVEGIRDELHRP